MYRLELVRAAEDDFAALDRGLQILALKQLRKLENHPQAGKPLGKRLGFDLSGYRSLHFGGQRCRIVYRFDEAAATVTVMAIGKKAKFEVYRQAAERREQE